MTTLTQPSCFSLKILYACGASVRGSSCVITCAHASMSTGLFLILSTFEVEVNLAVRDPSVESRQLLCHLDWLS